jgi:POT family proton-dependent oligopeptide transporter
MTADSTGDIFGQPRGIFYLVFAEACTNLSFYGMRILLVLYMTHQLLLPGHADHVLWLAPLRAAFAGSYGPLSTVALASAIFGLFSSVAYLTPLGGALIADRWLGRTRAILIGGALMILGDLLLTIEAGFVTALLTLLIGTGLFGGNLTAQLGELYARDDPRRGDGFQLYYLAVDAGVIVAPLVCGTLGEVWGYGYGFAAAGLGMIAALGAYLAGRRHLPPDPPLHRHRAEETRTRITRQGWQAVALLLVLIPVIGVAAVANNQIYGAYELWGAAHYDLVFFGHHMPVTWLISVDAFISFGCGFVILALWRWLEARHRLPSEIDRCAFGTFLSAIATLILAFAAWSAHGHKIGLAWGLAFHTLNNLGIGMLFPLTLALFSRAAPEGLAATMINSSRLNFFVSFLLVGWLGGFIDRIDGARFWLIHAALVALAGAVLLAFGRLFPKLLAPSA